MSSTKKKTIMCLLVNKHSTPGTCYSPKVLSVPESSWYYRFADSFKPYRACFISNSISVGLSHP